MAIALRAQLPPPPPPLRPLPPLPLLLLPLLLLLLSSCSPAAALTDSLEIWAADAYSAEALVGFGFEAGGSYELTFELTKAGDFDPLSDFTDASENSTNADRMLAAACTDDELRKLALADASKGAGAHALTPPCDMSVCSRVLRFDAPTLVMAEPNVRTAEYLTFVLANCGGESVRGKASYTILNPGGAHLGTDLAPLPTAYMALVGGWAVVLVLWVLNLCKFRDHNVVLQRVLTLVPVAKFISVGLRMAYYQQGAATGDLPSSIMYFSYIVYILYKAAFFSVLLLIAKGWLISRPSLDESEQRSLFCIVMSFCLMLVGYAFFPSFQSSYGLLMLCGVYFWIIHTVFASSLRNVRALEMQIYMIRQHGVDPATTPVPARMRMFYKFRTYLALFVFSDLLITTVVTIALTRMLWLEITLHEVVDILFFIGIGWTFRMREFNPYFYEIPIAQSAHQIPTVQAVPVQDSNDSGLQEWQVGQALPAAPTEMLYPEGATVVIEGPSTMDEAGNRVGGSVMVGRRQDQVETDWGADAEYNPQGGLPGHPSASRYDSVGGGRADGGAGSVKKKKKKKKHHHDEGGGLGP